MNFYCALTAVPIRKEANHRAEMVSQLLFGESVEKIAEENNWLKIKCAFDNYEGWVEKNCLQLITVNIPSNFRKKIVSGISKIYLDDENISISIVSGSEIYFYDNQVWLNGKPNKFVGDVVDYDFENKFLNKEKLLHNAFSFLSTPYLWGGKSLYGTDCSGFTQTVFKLAQIKLPRDAWQQAEIGNLVSFEKKQNCDLAFFKNDKEKITHVGICLDENKIIHCSIQVRIDKLDEKGIWNEALQQYTHQLAFIKNVSA